MNPDGGFHIIGFTRDEILDGGLARLMSLSDRVLRRSLDLSQRLGPLVVAARNRLVVQELVEVYFLSPFDPEGMKAFREQYGRYQLINFLNDTALRLCDEFQIALPPIIGQTTRAQLDETQLGIFMRYDSFSVA